MSSLKNTTISDNIFLQLPAGTDAQRPGSPTAAQLRYNTTSGNLEAYSSLGTAWKTVEPNHVAATGGVVYDTTDGNGSNYRVHVFNQIGNSTLTVTEPGEVEYLIVAGGGGGGDTSAGGGGGGGLINGYTNLSATTYTITVGDGGDSSNAYSSGTSGQGGFQGANSVAFGLTALGGGGGGSYQNPGTKINGGSGGGVRGDAQNRSYTAYPSTATQPGQGYGVGHRGGTTPGLSNGNPSSGGGGAGEIGQDCTANNGGDGGRGLGVYTNGRHTFYAGGGGGSGGYNASGRSGIITNGLGGYGGGGNGGRRSRFDQDEFCTDGGDGTGGGGGGNGYDGGGHAAGVKGGAYGGSGVVIIRYPLNPANKTSAPKVTNRNVVFDFDFGNPASYAGWGSTTVYDSKGSNTGTVTGSPIYMYPGSHRAAFRFDGVDDHIGLGRTFCDKQEIGTGNVSYSMEAWFKLNANPPGVTTSGYSIFGNASATGIGMQAVYVSSSIRVNFGARSTSNFNSNTGLSLNTWYHVVCVREAGVQNRIYINGQLDGTFSGGSLTVLSTSGEMQIGWANTRVNNRMNGEIATAKLYNTWLTAQEVEDNFNATRWRFGV